MIPMQNLATPASPVAANHHQASTTAAIDQPLSEPLDACVGGAFSEDVKHALWQALTDEQGSVGILTRGAQVWFAQYYAKQCRYALIGQGRYCSAQTHQDVVFAIDLIRASSSFDEVLAQLRDSVRNRNVVVNDENLKATIWLAARIWSMHEIGVFACTVPSKENLIWMQNSLPACIGAYYEKSTSTEDAVLLARDLNAATLERFAGFKIVWTDNLREHLNVRSFSASRPLELSVFHHARYLKAMQTYGPQDLFPEGLLAETLSTLALLFPLEDRMLRDWSEKKVKRDDTVDEEVLNCGHHEGQIDRRLSAFPYWRARLVLLKRFWEASEPQTVQQLFTDRREKQKWFGTWLAILALLLTAFFGLIQSIEGAWQVVRTYDT